MKLADALDSKSSGSDTVPVRLRPAAPSKRETDNKSVSLFALLRNEKSNLRFDPLAWDGNPFVLVVRYISRQDISPNRGITGQRHHQKEKLTTRQFLFLRYLRNEKSNLRFDPLAWDGFICLKCVLSVFRGGNAVLFIESSVEIRHVKKARIHSNINYFFVSMF